MTFLSCLSSIVCCGVEPTREEKCDVKEARQQRRECNLRRGHDNNAASDERACETSRKRRERAVIAHPLIPGVAPADTPQESPLLPLETG